ncbi:MAG: DUF971 domain-containing protein [Ilumatobacteraceae bacterium]
MPSHDIESVEVDRASHVDVVFDDGVRARYELGPLRLACPCADCNSKRQRDLPVQAGVERGDSISITNAELSGAWGLNLDWSDGHSTGIYAWERLREWLDDGIVGTVIT